MRTGSSLNSILAAHFLLFFAACDSGGSASFTLEGLPGPQVRTPYSQQLVVDGFGEEVRFEKSAGDLPYGLELEPSGLLMGTPIAVQHVEFTVTATAVATDQSWTASAAWTVTDAQGMRLLVEPLPVARPGEAYQHQLTAVGGNPSGFQLVRARTFTAGAGDPEAPLPNTESAPDWLSLDETTGLLSGTPDDQASIVLLLVEATEGNTSAQETYALRVGDPAEAGWLLEKSEAYVDRLFEVHVPSGLHLALEGGSCYANYGDSCCWTGTAMGGLAFRAAVTGEPEAYDKVSTLLTGLRTLRLVTGVPGLPGRAYEHRENIDGSCGTWFLDPELDENFHYGSGEYAEYRFMADVSRDQFSGNIWGHAIVYEVLADSPEFRSLASENIVAMTAHLWDNEMKMIDVDGLPTNYGTMSGYGFDGLDPYELGVFLPNGMNALMLLNWFQLSSQIAENEATRATFAQRLDDLMSDEDNPEPSREFEHSYLDLLADNYAYSAYPAGANYFNDTSWYNVHMAFSNYFHLVRRAGAGLLRDRAMEAFTNVLWKDAETMASGCDRPEARRARREWNPHYAWQYLAALGDRDAEAIFECLSMLLWFADPPRRDYAVANPLGLETVPGHPDFACEAVPIHLRPPSSNYIWHREPYRHTGGLDTPNREDGGGDGFVPYWMGRYFGFVPANI